MPMAQHAAAHASAEALALAGADVRPWHHRPVSLTLYCPVHANLAAAGPRPAAANAAIASALTPVEGCAPAGRPKRADASALACAAAASRCASFCAAAGVRACEVQCVLAGLATREPPPTFMLDTNVGMTTGCEIRYLRGMPPACAPSEGRAIGKTLTQRLLACLRGAGGVSTGRGIMGTGAPVVVARMPLECTRRVCCTAAWPMVQRSGADARRLGATHSARRWRVCAGAGAGVAWRGRWHPPQQPS